MNASAKDTTHPAPPPVYYVTGRELATPLDCRGDMCPACSGTGEGMRDGATCTMCGGSGEVGPWPIFDEPYGLDAGDFDDYMVGSYAAAVA